MSIDDYEAPEDSMLGRYAFAPQRTDKKLPLEPNTSIEQHLLRALEKHITDEKKLSQEDAALIQHFIKNDEYVEIFNEPTKDWVYRGMGVEPRWIKNVIDENEFESNESGLIEKSFIYEPWDATSSWSLSNIVAMNFSMNYSFEGVEIILHANVDDNRFSFFSGPKGFYRVGSLSGVSKEQEVIGVGKIKVSKISWRKKKNASRR